jgi:hypothetical protein
VWVGVGVVVGDEVLVIVRVGEFDGIEVLVRVAVTCGVVVGVGFCPPSSAIRSAARWPSSPQSNEKPKIVEESGISAQAEMPLPRQKTESRLHRNHGLADIEKPPAPDF